MEPVLLYQTDIDSTLQCSIRCVDSRSGTSDAAWAELPASCLPGVSGKQLYGELDVAALESGS